MYFFVYILFTFQIKYVIIYKSVMKINFSRSKNKNGGNNLGKKST